VLEPWRRDEEPQKTAPFLKRGRHGPGSRTLCEPVLVNSRTGLRPAEMEIEKWRAETGARNPPRKGRNTRNCQPETGAPQPNPRECRRFSPHREITAQRPDSLADEAVPREPVSPCYSLFSPVMFGKTGSFPFSRNDLRSIFFQVLSTFPSVMVVSLRCKTCDHFSTKQGYFFKVSGTL